MKKHYLALDLGAESGRAIVGSLSDGKLSLTEPYRFLNQPVSKPDGLHWDVSNLWDEIRRSISISVEKFQLESLGVDTWGVDFVLLDQDGKLLSDPHHYRDARTDGMLEAAYKRIPREKIFAQTGIQFMQINTLYQLLSMVIAKDPQLGAAKTFLTIPNLFNYWLSGQIACELTHATTTQCFNPVTRSWAFPLLDALGIPTHIFPSVCEPGTCLGDLLPAVVSVTEKGIPPGNADGVLNCAQAGTDTVVDVGSGCYSFEYAV